MDEYSSASKSYRTSYEHQFDSIRSSSFFWFWRIRFWPWMTVLRRIVFWRVRNNQTSKEFCRRDDSIPYLDNAKIIFLLTLQNTIRLSRYSVFHIAFLYDYWRRDRTLPNFTCINRWLLNYLCQRYLRNGFVENVKLWRWQI